MKPAPQSPQNNEASVLDIGMPPALAPAIKMRKAKPRTIATPLPEQELTRWSCSLFGDKSEIDVFVESTGQWQTAAEVHAVGGFDAEDVAAFITEAIAVRLKKKTMEQIFQN